MRKREIDTDRERETDFPTGLEEASCLDVNCLVYRKGHQAGDYRQHSITETLSYKYKELKSVQNCMSLEEDPKALMRPQTMAHTLIPGYERTHLRCAQISDLQKL